MSLTREQVQRLTEPLPIEDHEFNNDGLTYVTEHGVTTRLDEIDPSWEFQIMEIRERDGVSICTGRLTLCGVFRENVGMDSVKLSKDKTREVNEREKSAATDALKRCARSFGIGRYLLKAKGINSPEALQRWLANRDNPAPVEPDEPELDRNKPFTMETWKDFIAAALTAFPDLTTEFITSVIPSGRQWNAKGGTYQSAVAALKAAIKEQHPEWKQVE